MWNGNQFVSFCFLAFNKLGNLPPCIWLQLGIRVKVEARQINAFLWRLVIPSQFFICQPYRLRVAALGTGPNLLNLRLSRSQVTRPLATYVPYISSAFSKIVWHHSFSSSFMTREFFTISLLRHSKSTLSGDDQWCYFTFLTTCPQGKLDMKIGCPV
jgi:hypothetical protein